MALLKTLALSLLLLLLLVGLVQLAHHTFFRVIVLIVTVNNAIFAEGYAVIIPVIFVAKHQN